MRKLSSGRLSNLPKVTQVVGDKAGNMNPGSLTPAPTLNHCYFCSRQMATEVVRGRTQEALKPPGACYLLLPGLEGAGIESLVSRASFCALRTPQPRGELERLLTTLNCSADRPQIGMGRAMMCLLQPLPGLSKRKAQLWASAAKVLTRTRRRSPRGRELARGYPGRGHTVTSPARVGPRGSDVALLTTTGPRCFWGLGSGSTPALTARPPAGSQRSASEVADLRTRLPEAGHLDHSRGSPEKALPSLGTANPQPGLGASSAESLPKSNAETPWANQRPQRSEGRVLAPPHSLLRPRNPSAKTPRSNQRWSNGKGRGHLGPFPSPLTALA